MAETAEVLSIDAIASFRVALLVYIGKIRPLLDDAADEVHRTGEWLRVTQRLHWENKVRAHGRELADAQQALFSAQLARLREPSSAELAAVHKARAALTRSEEMLGKAKRLAAHYERETQPRLKQVEELRNFLATELPKAALLLERLTVALEQYRLPVTGETSPAAAGMNTGATTGSATELTTQTEKDT